VELFGHPCGGKGVWKNTAINNYNKGCQWNSQLGKFIFIFLTISTTM
jgi:hypothetical protein